VPDVLEIKLSINCTKLDVNIKIVQHLLSAKYTHLGTSFSQTLRRLFVPTIHVDKGLGNYIQAHTVILRILTFK